MAGICIDYRVRYSEVDSYGHVTPSAMIKFLNDTGHEHMDLIRRTPGIKATAADTWVISQSYMKVYKYPRCKDNIRVKTWASSIDGKHAYRECQCYSKQGELLAVSRLLGTLVDRHSGKSKRATLSEDERVLWDLDQQPASEYEFIDFNMNGRPAVWRYNSMVNYQHIDFNGHANNVHYLEWFLGTIPAEFHRRNHLVSLELIYRRELKCKNTFTVKIAEPDIIAGNLVFVGQIEKQLGTIAAIGRMALAERF